MRHYAVVLQYYLSANFSYYCYQGGSTIASFREKSGAKINISTAQLVPERIVTITGDQAQIIETFRLISEKLEKV